MKDSLLQHKYKLLIVLLLVGILIERNTGVLFGKGEEKGDENDDVKVEITVVQEKPIATSLVTISAKPSQIVSPTVVISSTPKPTLLPSQSNSDFFYPNATTLSSQGEEVVLESSSDPGEITDWYTQKIKEKNMNANTFVRTNSNGNVLNKLAASNGNEKIAVEITRNSGEQKTKIKINR